MSLRMTLEEIRDLVGECEIVGEPDFLCRSVAPLDAAEGHQLSFVKHSGYFDQARASRAGALFVPEWIEGSGAHQLVVASPFLAFGLVLQRIAREKRRQPAGIHPKAVIGEPVHLGGDVTIGPGAVISDEAKIGAGTTIYANVFVGQRSTLGRECVIHPNVVIMEDVHLGDRVVVHGGTVIGADGYGYVQHDGRHLKVPQIGAVVVGDDVEIGALATIDRATLSETRIGRGTKIGDLCHVAHNCQIGEDVLFLPIAAIGGSVTIGDRATLAGRAACIDNLTIGEDATLAATAVAYKDVDAGAKMWGNPARERTREMRVQAGLSRLPEMRRELREIKASLESRAAG